MICPKCGAEISEDSVFCNKCGSRLNEADNEPIQQFQEELKINNVVANETLKVNKLKCILKNKKVLIPVLIICCLIISTGITYLAIKPPSADEVFNKVKDYKSEDEISYLNKVYPSDGGFLGLFEKQNYKNKKAVLAMEIKYLGEKFQSENGRSIDDYTAVKITNVDIESKGYDSDYTDINVTINNGGTTPINYIKVNLYFKDESGNIVKSEWTNDDSNIQPSASQVLTKMTEKKGWSTVSAEIAEIK